MADLSVTIGGDSSDLSEEISRVERQLRTLERRREARVRIGADVGDLDRRINQTNANLSSLRTNLNQTTTAADRFNRSSANGSNTLTQFSRIAQDAPFGIMGIGNNLTATAESFAHLSSSAGGAGNALRAVGASLLGTGGILLAVSLVTTALTYMSQQGLTVGDVFDKLSGSFDETANTLKKASEESNKSAQEEIATLKALIFTAKNEALSRKDRLIAVEQLQKQYPGYFGNLSQEQILYGDLSKAIKDVSQALIDKALADKLASKAGDAQFRLLQLNFDLIKAKEAQTKAEQEYLKAARAGNATVESFALGVEKAKNRVQEVRNEWLKAQKQLESYQNVLNNRTSSSIRTQATAPKAVKKAKEVNTNEPVIRFKSFLEPITADQLKPFDNAINEALNFSVIQNVAVQTNELLQLLVDFNDEASQIIQGSLTDTFGSLGNAIGNAISTGGSILNAVGNSLLASLGGFLSDMGGLLIKYGTLAVLKGKLDLAILTGGPVSIGAGIAAIAVGVALKAAGSAIGNAARSGSSGSSGTTGRDYSSPASSISSGSGGSFTNGSVVFEISGTSLIGVLSNSLAKNSRLGGTLGI